MKKVLIIAVLLCGANTWCMDPSEKDAPTAQNKKKPKLKWEKLQEKKRRGKRLTPGQERILKRGLREKNALPIALRAYIDAQIKIAKSVKTNKNSQIGENKKSGS